MKTVNATDIMDMLKSGKLSANSQEIIIWLVGGFKKRFPRLKDAAVYFGYSPRNTKCFREKLEAGKFEEVIKFKKKKPFIHRKSYKECFNSTRTKDMKTYNHIKKIKAIEDDMSRQHLAKCLV